ncbi:MAG: DUF2612 domain-containing protein, partial [Rhodospirillales bacterium]|nr:DUF2612 domain-containing protein [Rhodospirillales bacterium]
MALATDYTGLVTSEHADKPKFMAMVAAVAQGFANATNAADSLPGSFDL